MPYFLALDAGGTKTDYVLAEDESVLARVRTGSIKRMRVDAATAVANLETGLGELSAVSGLAMSQVHSTCIGTAGETVPSVTEFLRSEFAARVGGSLLLLGDVEIALDAAFRGEPGVLVLAGTGSNVAGRTASGRIVTAGGWGPALADQGSGHRIGHQALRAAVLAYDEGRPNLLLDAILQHWQLRDFHELVDWANRSPAPDFSRLTHIVLACAEAGDTLAQEQLAEQGRELGYLVRLILRRLEAESSNQSVNLRLAFAGSILERVRPVRDALLDHVRSEFPEAVELPGVVDPVDGALWRARDAFASP